MQNSTPIIEMLNEHGFYPAAQKLADFEAIVFQAAAVRKAQKHYFKNRDQMALQHSKEMEKQLDNLLSAQGL